MTQTPVTFVKELVGFPFLEGDHKQWQTEDGTYVVTSWAPEAVVGDHVFTAETALWVSDSHGYPLDYNTVTDDTLVHIEDDKPRHEDVLAKAGYAVSAVANQESQA